MRRYLLTTSIAAFIVVVAPATGATPDSKEDTLESVAVAVQRVTADPPYVRDELAMLLIGTALIGLAAAVRRADFH
jgi:hypothetical protein